MGARRGRRRSGSSGCTGTAIGERGRGQHRAGPVTRSWRSRRPRPSWCSSTSHGPPRASSRARAAVYVGANRRSAASRVIGGRSRWVLRRCAVERARPSSSPCSASAGAARTGCISRRRSAAASRGRWAACSGQPAPAGRGGRDDAVAGHAADPADPDAAAPRRRPVRRHRPGRAAGELAVPRHRAGARQPLSRGHAVGCACDRRAARRRARPGARLHVGLVGRRVPRARRRLLRGLCRRAPVRLPGEGAAGCAVYLRQYSAQDALAALPVRGLGSHGGACCAGERFCSGPAGRRGRCRRCSRALRVSSRWRRRRRSAYTGASSSRISRSTPSRRWRYPTTRNRGRAV